MRKKNFEKIDTIIQYVLFVLFGIMGISLIVRGIV